MPDVTTSLRIPNYASAPSGLSGQLYFNSTDKQFYYHDGTNWIMLGLASSSGNVSNSGVPTVGQLAQWTDATHIQGIANTLGQWTGTATGLVAATGRTSLGASTIGADIFTRAAPGTTSWIKASAIGAITYEDAATTKTSLSLNAVTNDAQTKASIVPNTVPSGGQLLIGSGLGGYGIQTISGSGATITLGTSGVLTISAIANASLAGNTSGWDTAVTEKRQWDGGATNLTAVTGRRSLVIGDSEEYENASTSSQTNLFATDTIVGGSTVTIPAGGGTGGQYRCVFDMTKTAAGVVAWQINVRFGTGGSTSDALAVNLTAAVGQTAVVDGGWFEVLVNIRATGVSCQFAAIARMTRVTATAVGLLASATPVYVLGSIGGVFSASTATKISISFNGGTSFQGTNSVCQAEYKQ
jgi:hypothetical protein